ncbi:MAG: 5-dehydro-4-deoxy-D-glucuronate isomerase [Bryobacteraceae bacterium]
MPSIGSSAVPLLSPAELRKHFVLDQLFQPGAASIYSTDLDRLVIGGIMPEEDIQVSGFHELGSSKFCLRRETGILNIGGPGIVQVDDEEYLVRPLDCLYVGAGERDLVFRRSKEAVASPPAAFFLLSCPAHRSLPTRQATKSDALVFEVGDAEKCARRRLHRYICPERIESCQLTMGFTEMLPGSVWNTMPPHTHSRRSEVYLYFDLHESFVLHLMGEAPCTRHLIIRDRQVVLSPSWSLHCGVGTASYRFVWGMAGENQDFDDMDPIVSQDLL